MLDFTECQGCSAFHIQIFKEITINGLFGVWRQCGESPVTVLVALRGMQSTGGVPWLSLLVCLPCPLCANLRVFASVKNDDSA